MNDGGDTMKEPLDLSKYSVRTDLAVEAHQMLQERQEEQKGIEGVIVKRGKKKVLPLQKLQLMKLPLTRWVKTWKLFNA